MDARKSSRLRQSSVYTMQRVYAATNASIATDDLSTLNSKSADSISNPHATTAPLQHRQSGSSSGQKNPSSYDSFHSFSPLPNAASSPPPQPFASATLRPSSSSTTRSDNRSSRATFQAEPNSSHSHHHFPHFHRHGSTNDFVFPRPSDEEIEALFENVVRTRDLSSLPPLTIDQKWSMVESDERLRFNEEKAREEQAKKQSRSGMIEEKSPEWYLVKFMDKTITPKDASGLVVLLRGHELVWFQQFVAIRGTRVLAQYLSYISSKGTQRAETDHQLEYEILRCIKQILNSWNAARDALTHNLFVAQLASSLNSPRLPARKLVAELLTFLVYRIPDSINLVTGALEAVSIANNTGSSPYAYWFASFEKSIAGRGKRGGKRGGLVGVSDEVRKNAATESNINEYALSNLLLINGILENTEDLDLRIHHESQMATAGLRQIMELCRSFNFDNLNIHLDSLQETIENDEKELRERLDQEFPRDLTNIEDVYAALKTRTLNSKAQDHLLSILQHLLLVREDGPGLVQYFQLLDSLVTDVVMGHKLSGAEQRLGKSVESIISQFLNNDPDRFRNLGGDAQMRADLRRLQLEKDTLKGKIASLEEELQNLCEATTRFQVQLETQQLS